jgi:hypothetical protein
MDRISDSGSDDMGSNPVGVTKCKEVTRNGGLFAFIGLFNLVNYEEKF